jgi:hypothetical protein
MLLVLSNAKKPPNASRETLRDRRSRTTPWPAWGTSQLRRVSGRPLWAKDYPLAGCSVDELRVQNT